MKHLPASHWQLKAVVNNMNKILERKIDTDIKKTLAVKERNNS